MHISLRKKRHYSCETHYLTLLAWGITTLCKETGIEATVFERYWCPYSCFINVDLSHWYFGIFIFISNKCTNRWKCSVYKIKKINQFIKSNCCIFLRMLQARLQNRCYHWHEQQTFTVPLERRHSHGSDYTLTVRLSCSGLQPVSSTTEYR